MEPVPQLEDLPPLDGKRVLVRTDFNVPLRDRPDGTREIVDDLRIRAALPTISWLPPQGAPVMACSPLGRPQGDPDPHYTMEPGRQRRPALAPGLQLLATPPFSRGRTAQNRN